MASGMHPQIDSESLGPRGPPDIDHAVMTDSIRRRNDHQVLVFGIQSKVPDRRTFPGRRAQV